jgi:thiamine-monophosphate kinase
MKERDFIERLERIFRRLAFEDDAAVHQVRSHEPPGLLDGILTFATDAAVEGIHFDRRYSTLSQAVQKLVTSNVSDIYAMGGKPEKILFTAGLKEGCTEAEADDIVDGLRKASLFYMVHPVGGDTVCSGDRFFFNIMIVGSQRHTKPIERSGAGVGDRIVLFGECGGSLLGMDLLRHLSGIETSDLLPPPIGADLPSWDEISRLLPELEIIMDEAGLDLLAGSCGDIRRHLISLAKRHIVPEAIPVDIDLLSMDPMPLTAMIDVSDGLARDLRNLCRASGVGAVIHEELLPVPEAFSLFLGDEKKRWTDYVFSSGEEYVMLASCREEPPSGRVIGEIVPAGEGLTLIGRDGERRALPDAGYEHTF